MVALEDLNLIYASTAELYRLLDRHFFSSSKDTPYLIKLSGVLGEPPHCQQVAQSLDDSLPFVIRLPVRPPLFSVYEPI